MTRDSASDDAVAGDPVTWPPADPLPHPKRIGPYRILQVLGEGGMGLVYEAEQSEPVVRRVALKVLKPGLDTKQIVARFEAERQALAVMDHPGIAKVLDAGATPTGHPYFVMELVRGIPLTEYCDNNQLDTRRRLELFVDVCHAVQHAHHKGVVHRDLKPWNVLVTDRDGRPTPKVIDFGVAKAIAAPLTERTLVTQHGQAVGTPAYMSPEQAEMSGLDVDTRTDIYALGVMLYELLVGRLPIEPREMGVQAFLARLVMRETDPPTPSARFLTSGDARLHIAVRRHTDVRGLERELKGDLDWIVMKAMQKDRTRRYETANGLALDIQRHLNDEPVLARPPSTIDRFAKFVRRHRVGVVAGAAVLLALVAGVVLATAGLVRATRAERQAAAQAETARQVSEFLVSLFRVSDPSEARGNSITARELLDRASRRIEGELATQPAVRARLLATMGEVYRSLGLYDEAAPMLERALAVRRERLGENHPEVATSLAQLGQLFLDRGRYDESQGLYARALALQEQALPPDHVDLAGTLTGLANLHAAVGRLEEAEPLARRAVAIRAAALGSDHPDLATSMAALASLLVKRGEYAAADSLYVRVLAMRERALGPDHPDVALTLSNLGGVRWIRRQYDDAERFMQRSLDVRRKILGPDHPDLADVLNNLGVLQWTQGEYARAAELYEEARRIWEDALGPDHLRVGMALNNLAEAHWKLGDYDRAEPLFRRALAIKRRLLESQHPSIAVTLNGLANLLRDQRRYRDAEPLYREALALREAALGPTDAATVETLTDYAALLRAMGREAEARGLEARVGR